MHHLVTGGRALRSNDDRAAKLAVSLGCMFISTPSRELLDDSDSLPTISPVCCCPCREPLAPRNLAFCIRVRRCCDGNNREMRRLRREPRGCLRQRVGRIGRLRQ